MTIWTPAQVEEILRTNQWFGEVSEIQNATRFTLKDGTPVDCYVSGKVVVGGKATEIRDQVSVIFADSYAVVKKGTDSPHAQQAEVKPSRVFIVYGHDVEAREQLELLLRRLKLEPIVLQNLPGDGDTIIEKLETLTSAGFACVLLTPDDSGQGVTNPTEFRPRARQNVVLELGMVLAKLGRPRVAILVKGEGLERPTDIDGLIYIPFKEKIEEEKNKIAANLQQAGFDIHVSDLIAIA